MAMGVHAQQPVSPRTVGIPGGTFDGRPVVKELPQGAKRLIDAIRRLHEEPGLILNRKAIYATLQARPGKTSFRLTDGSRNMVEELMFEDQSEMRGWQARLNFWDHQGKGTWSVGVAMQYEPGLECLPSTSVEAYWGKPFIYRMYGTHNPLYAGPHDGFPYSAQFPPTLHNTSNASFFNGVGGCLSSVSAGRTFNHKEYSYDGIYHE